MKPSILSRKKEKTYTLVAVVFWLLFWQFASMLLKQEILLVSPVSVVQKLFVLLPTKDFWQSIGFTMGHISLGFLLGLLFGSLFAIVSAFFQGIRILLSPLMTTVKTVPVASFVILALFFLPSKHLSIFISFLMVFPIFYSNLLTGILSTDEKLLEMAKVFRLSPLQKFRYIYLSQVLPFFRTAASLALGLCWKSGIAAEVIGIPSGSIGEKLYEAKIYLATADLFAWTLVIVLISLAFEKIFLTLMDKIVWRMEGREKVGYIHQKP